MKKTLSILIALLFVLVILSGCTAAPTSKETTAKTTAGTTTTEAITTVATTVATTTEATTTEATTTQGAAEFGSPLTVGEYVVTVQKVITSKDYEGKNAITVVYDWTNHSEKTVAPIFAVRFKVFQDGKELESAILLDDKSASSTAEVRPDISVEGLSDSFTTTSSKSELEIEVNGTFSLGEPVLLKVPFPQD